MEPENELRDPSTSAQRLYEIAQERTDLHAQILSHPNVYPGLAEWVRMVSPGVQPAGGGPASESQWKPSEASTPSTAPTDTKAKFDPVATQETQVLPVAELQATSGASNVAPSQPIQGQPVHRQSVMGHPATARATQGQTPQVQPTQSMGPASAYGMQGTPPQSAFARPGQVPQGAGYQVDGQAQAGPMGVQGGVPTQAPNFSAAPASEESKPKSSWLYVLIGVLAALIVGGLVFGAFALFSSDKGGDEELVVKEDETVVQEPLEMEELNKEEEDPSRLEESTTQRYAGASIPGAYPGAGGPIPAEAREAATLRYEQYGTYVVFKTPTGNIGCDLEDDWAGCGVISYIQDKTAGTAPDGDPQWWFIIPSSGEATVGPRGDAPLFLDTSQPIEVLEYGQIVYWGDTVCASESTGLTCWNAVTGHGAFMSRESYTLF